MASTHIERLASHPQSPSAKWQKFQQGEADRVVRTAAERERRDTERHDSTEYVHTERQQTQEG